MKLLLLIITFLGLSCNITDERTKCENEYRDEVTSRPYSCTSGILLGQTLLNRDPNSRSNPNSAGNILTNIGILMCLEEVARSRDCRNKSHIKPTNQKGNYFGY